VRCDSRLFRIHDNQCDRRTVLAPASGQIADEIIDVHQPRIASHDGRWMSRDLEYANMRCCGAIARIAGFKNFSDRNC